MSEFERYLTVAEVAETLRCAKGTLYNLLWRGQLEFLRPRKVLGKWLIPAAAVQQALARRAASLGTRARRGRR